MTAAASLHERSVFDGRFAPSPTGDLHLGSLRTALVAWLFARSAGARFVVRIEDLDPDRVVPGMERRQLKDLAAIGMDWDGEPVRQSERLEIYRLHLNRLVADGLVYPCFCSRADIRAAASAPHGTLPEGAYPGECASIASASARQRIDAGEQHSLRVRAAAERIAYDDDVMGRVELVVDDFVLVRKDGVPAYNLAVVVDDCLQGIGQVVRGDDLAASTPRQLLLARLLALEPPRYAHVPLVLGADGTRLAKRHGSVTLGEWCVARREAPRQVLAWLARSIGMPEDVAAVGDARALLDAFDPARIPQTPIRIDDVVASRE